MADNPWLKFYPQDWRGEPTLRACSIAARGLWVEMISLAHEAVPYGHVLVNRNAPDIPTLARMVGVTESECELLIAELDRNGVFSRTRKGVIYSRRMVKDAKKASHARNIGKMGGNPALCKQSKKPVQDNGLDKASDKPQKPEARSQKVKKGSGEPLPDSGFDSLWVSWSPYRMTKGSKTGARAEWNRHVRKAGLDPGMVTAQAVAYCDECQRTDTKTQHVERWLKKHRWTDERLPTKPNGTRTTAERRREMVEGLRDAGRLEDFIPPAERDNP